LTDAQYAKWLELGSSKWIKRILDEYQSLLNQGAPARDEKK
jgi:esterase/lipase